jgi:disulfide bond formation protein DsbB
MLTALTARRAVLLVFVITLATIAGAWMFQLAGYVPCQLCYQQRIAYYGVVPLSLLLLLGPPNWTKPGLYVAGAIMLASAAFGIFHAGIEWNFWVGPTTCGGDVSDGLPDLTQTFAKCNEAALRIFGISLAGYNALISAAVAVIALSATHDQVGTI